MSDIHFRYLAQLAFDLTGIVLSENKRSMIYGRIMKRMRQLSLTSVDDYCHLLQVNDNNETASFINAITTNLTAFFRENYHFKFLNSTAFDEFKLNNPERKIRIWSAGCSTGQEPYSIAMCTKELLPYWDCKILATDLDSEVLCEAKAGMYNNLQGVPRSFENKYCKHLEASVDQYSLIPEIKDMVLFKQLNLLKSWPIKGPLDAIFCRNVLIYFNDETKRKIIQRFYSLLKPGGYLFLGHSESLQSFSTGFDLLGQTIYQRKA